jgi:hypothetical protein
MKNLSAGLLAGFVATVVLSLLMVAKTMMGVMPQLDVIAMLSAMMGGQPPLVGWLAHFMIGTLLWGGGFALFYGRIPGRGPVARGVAFGVGAWLAMMVMVMPMAGGGLFGLNFGVMAPVMTLMLHAIFGAVLGGVYGAATSTAHTGLSHA